ncbi:MAG TPA: xanthine dehydrogenase family protein molybdopterin-binding subunit [Symbiobacteriaceae bacterium]|nr:xanthine dehydrogenase family protein molybdopterin-binding subunit [Symbiobacteriaceae bacterium]
MSTTLTPNHTWIGRSVPRVDAPAKLRGEPVYMTDLKFENPCFGRVLRSTYPHARIRSIDTRAAEALPGVICVLTHNDVPGLNGFGIVIPDQPVLCREKVRMMGDAVALVAAETPAIAAQALGLIKVEYDPLPVVDDPVAAMLPCSPLVHEGGNIHLRTIIRRGDVEQAFGQAAVVADHVYHTPRQAHMFLETEGGWGRLEPDGTLTIWCPAQAAFRDRLQLARLLDWDPERIREVSSPSGGAFGGKDELTVQHHLALLALHTGGRPVKLHLSREESMVAGIKRHPFTIHMRTAAAADGTLLAQQAFIVADTGAYASLGGPVLNLAIEHIGGVYRIPNLDVEGYCVYTNNGISGAFRGFGVPQVLMALESNIDEIARKLGRDPLDLRRQNALHRGELSAIGNPMTTAVGTQACLEALEQSTVWRDRASLKAAANDPWKRRGVGIGVCMQGLGLGKGIPDYGAAVVELLPDGRFKVGISIQEIGTGNQTAYAQFAAEALGCSVADIDVIQGDTGYSADSGTVTATRSVFTGGKAIQLAGEKMVALLKGCAGRLLDADPSALTCADGRVGGRVSYAACYAEARRQGLDTKVQGSFHWPEADEEIPGAFGLPHHIYGYGAQAALVEVDTLTGEVQVLQVASVLDAGKAVNPLGVEAQSDGGVAQGIGLALMEETVITEGRFKNPNMSTYIIPTAGDVPRVDTYIVEVPEEMGPTGAKGLGEVPIVPTVPAVFGAIYDAVGVQLLRAPATPERVWLAMQGAPSDDTPELRARLAAAREAGLRTNLLQTEGEGYAQPKGPDNR